MSLVDFDEGIEKSWLVPARGLGNQETSNIFPNSPTQPQKLQNPKFQNCHVIVPKCSLPFFLFFNPTIVFHFNRHSLYFSSLKLSTRRVFSDQPFEPLRLLNLDNVNRIFKVLSLLLCKALCEFSVFYFYFFYNKSIFNLCSILVRMMRRHRERGGT